MKWTVNPYRHQALEPASMVAPGRDPWLRVLWLVGALCAALLAAWIGLPRAVGSDADSALLRACRRACEDRRPENVSVQDDASSLEAFCWCPR